MSAGRGSFQSMLRRRSPLWRLTVTSASCCGLWLRAGTLRASDARNRDPKPQDAPGRLVSDVGLVPGVRDTDVEATPIVVAEDTGQHELVQVVFVSDDAVVNPKNALVDRVGHPAAALF